MANLLKSFSNITRIKILSCLNDQDRNVTGLIKNCNISQSAVSQHLRKLRDMGVIACEAKGRDRIYKLKDRQAGKISRQILKLIKN